MWVRWTLYLLYMLQLVVLPGMVATYLYRTSSSQRRTVMMSPTQPEPSTPPIQNSITENERAERSRAGKSVKMKPISLNYLRQNVPNVRSQEQFMQLFVDSDSHARQPNRWLLRTARSADHSKGQESTWRQDHKEDQYGYSNTAGKYDESRTVMLESARLKPTTSEDNNEEALDVAVEAVVDVKDEEEFDDYDVSYPQDEPSHEKLEALEAALHHIEEMSTCSTSKCKIPTPYVLNVRDPLDRTRVFIPECVVLHRCMNYSGCCGDTNHECVPRSMNVVTKHFLIVDRLASRGDYVMFNPNMATTLSFINHTECECREKPKIPKCSKKCPRSFRLSQEGTNCLCDCFPSAYEDNWACESVKEGLVPLSHHDLVCIKNGNCYIPQCQDGEFSIKHGFCPLSDNYALPAFLFKSQEERRSYREHLQSFDFSSRHGDTSASRDDTTSQTVFEPFSPSSVSDLNSGGDEDPYMEIVTAPSSLELPQDYEESNLKTSHSIEDSSTTSELSHAPVSSNTQFSSTVNHINETSSNLSSSNIIQNSSVSQNITNHTSIGDDAKNDNKNDYYYSSEETDSLLDEVTDNIEEVGAEKSDELEEVKDFIQESVHSSEMSHDTEQVSSQSVLFNDAIPEITSSDVDKTTTMPVSSDEANNKKTSTKEEYRDDLVRQIALKNSLRSRLQVSSSFHENFRSDIAPTRTRSHERYHGEGLNKSPSTASPLYSSTSSHHSLPQVPLSSHHNSVPSHSLTASHPELHNYRVGKQTTRLHKKYSESSEPQSFDGRMHYDVVSEGSGDVH